MLSQALGLRERPKKISDVKFRPKHRHLNLYLHTLNTPYIKHLNFTKWTITEEDICH